MFKFVFVDPSAFSDLEATVILPVVLVWSVEDQAAVCTVGLCARAHEPQMCQSNTTGRAKASNWQEARLNKRILEYATSDPTHLQKVNIS